MKIIPLFKTLSLATILLALAACQTRISDASWPNDIPPKAYFVEVGRALIEPDSSTFERQLNTYLVWIKRFYQGSIIYPLGWNEMTDTLVSSLDESADHGDVRQRMYELGRKISAEWAQDDRKRKINSANVAAWGSALRTAVEFKQQVRFIEQVERDVEDLLSGKIDSSDINRARYYPPEDYNNF